MGSLPGRRVAAAALRPLWDEGRVNALPDSQLLRGSISEVVHELRAQLAPERGGRQGIKQRKLHARRLVRQYLADAVPPDEPGRRGYSGAASVSPRDKASLRRVKPVLRELVRCRAASGAAMLLDHLRQREVSPDAECYSLLLSAHAVNGELAAMNAVAATMAAASVPMDAACRRAFIWCAAVRHDARAAFAWYDKYVTAGHPMCERVLLYLMRVTDSHDVASRLLHQLPESGVTAAHLAEGLRVYAGDVPASAVASLWEACAAAQNDTLALDAATPFRNALVAVEAAHGDAPPAIRLRHTVVAAARALAKPIRTEPLLVNAMLRVFNRDLDIDGAIAFMASSDAWDIAGPTAYAIMLSTCAESITARIHETPAVFTAAADALWAKASLHNALTTYSVFTAMMHVHAAAGDVGRARALFDQYRTYRLWPKEEFYEAYATLLRQKGHGEEAVAVADMFQKAVRAVEA